MSSGFRPAVRTEAKPLIGLYSESGKGKTYSALLLAKGFCEDMSKVGMIETESGRGEVFASDPIVGGYNVLPIRDDFSPRNYGEAISAAGKAGLQVLIIDSASHEWEGSGGVLSMAAKNQEDGKKGLQVWQTPKIDHARYFMLKLLQTSVPLVIVCMRAKYPMKEVVKPGGAKEFVRADVVEPKQSDDILYEMMVHAWIDDTHSIHVTKYTEAGLRAVFIDGKPITVETGQALAEWARGGAKKSEPKQEAAKPAEPATEVSELDAKRNAVTLEAKRIGPAAFEECKMGCFIGTLKAASLDELQVLLEACREKPDQN